MRIKKIILLFQTRNERYWGFRLVRCSDAKMVEGKITGDESNILAALTSDDSGWVHDYFYTKKQLTEKELFAMPYAGCTIEDIREFVKKGFRK